MNEDRQFETVDSATGQAGNSVWLTGLVSAVQIPDDFDQRCRLASKAAFAIDRLRRERSRHQISDVSFERLVQALAHLGAIPLGEIQASLGIPNWGDVTLAVAPALGRLAKLIELPVEKAKLYVRGAYADPRGLSQPAFLGAETLSFEEAVRATEGLYTDAQRAEIDEIVRAIHREYERMG